VETYDLYMEKMAELTEGLRQSGRQVREFNAAGDPRAIIDGLPIAVGPGSQEGLLLRGDTYTELGNPSAGSSAFVMWTTDTSLVRDGRVILVGPGMQEAQAQRLPLGQVLIVGGAQLSKEEQPGLEQRQYVSNLVEGYMVKSSPGRVWSRVSKAVAAKGFDFEMLGKALIAILKTEFPKVESAEVLFVTSGKEEIQRLEEIAEQVRVLGKAFRRDAWRAKGFDLVECTMGTDCASCEEQPACDDIRDVVKIRRERDDEEGPWASGQRDELVQVDG
jgi:CO dehydrogenase/acetyl-CoA synthase beta subunit